MLRTLTTMGLSWFLWTKQGRKTACNIFRNSMPLIEKELGISIIAPLSELTKDPDEKGEQQNA